MEERVIIGKPRWVWKRGLLVALAVAVALIGAFVTYWLQTSEPVSSVDDRGRYRLIAQDGSVFDRARLGGHPYVTYFGYASCPDRCPAMLIRLNRIRTRLGLKPTELPIVFITVDPERDTPERMKAFATAVGGQIIALSGDTETINRVTDSAGVYARKVPEAGGGYRIDHTTKAFVYDAEGYFLDTVSPSESDADVAAKLRAAALAPQPTSSPPSSSSAAARPN